MDFETRVSSELMDHGWLEEKAGLDNMETNVTWVVKFQKEIQYLLYYELNSSKLRIVFEFGTIFT